jgi:hypothetical protein
MIGHPRGICNGDRPINQKLQNMHAKQKSNSSNGKKKISQDPCVPHGLPKYRIEKSLVMKICWIGTSVITIPIPRLPIFNQNPTLNPILIEAVAAIDLNEIASMRNRVPKVGPKGLILLSDFSALQFPYP